MMPRYAQYAVPHPLFAPALVKMVDPRLSETDPPRVHMVFALVDNPHRWQMHWTSYSIGIEHIEAMYRSIHHPSHAISVS